MSIVHTDTTLQNTNEKKIIHILLNTQRIQDCTLTVSNSRSLLQTWKYFNAYNPPAHAHTHTQTHLLTSSEYEMKWVRRIHLIERSNVSSKQRTDKTIRPLYRKGTGAEVRRLVKKFCIMFAYTDNNSWRPVRWSIRLYLFCFWFCFGDFLMRGKMKCNARFGNKTIDGRPVDVICSVIFMVFSVFLFFSSFREMPMFLNSCIRWWKWYYNILCTLYMSPNLLCCRLLIFLNIFEHWTCIMYMRKHQISSRWPHVFSFFIHSQTFL